MVIAQGNILAAYDAIAPHYAEYSEKYKPYLQAIENLVVQNIAPQTRLLDIGSGDGRRLKKICSSYNLNDVTAVEPSKEMAALCRKETGFVVHEICGYRLAEILTQPYDAITALWNVFGHMPDGNARLLTLQSMAKLLKPSGIIMLDINNRHNRLSYGKLEVLKRRVVDFLNFDEKRGDAHYEWNIAGKSFPAAGHLFTPAEIEKLFRAAGLKVYKRFSVNYKTGEISSSPFNGQLFYILRLA